MSESNVHSKQPVLIHDENFNFRPAAVKNRRLIKTYKRQLLESIKRLSHHVPKCVLSVLAKRANEDPIYLENIQHEFRTSVILFVDISGFTKLSTILDAESLSNVINDYFELIISEIESYGGNVLKFAGDAIFVEWEFLSENEMHHKESNSTNQSMLDVVVLAASCANSIVQKCSNYIAVSDSNVSEGFVLNVYCGLGFGNLIGMHAGSCTATVISDDNQISTTYQRREYLMVGEPINQAALAANKAQIGEVIASKEVMDILHRHGFSASNESFQLIVSKGENILKLPFVTPDESFHNGDIHILCSLLNKMNMSSLFRFREEMLFYAHDVVREIEDQFFQTTEEMDEKVKIYEEVNEEECPIKETVVIRNIFNNTKENLSLDNAELRSIYTIFIMPLISTNLLSETSNSNTPRREIEELLTLLNSVYIITLRELQNYGGQLRQFIVDDKGVVLIGTFGLRGSTYPHMVSERGLPATISIRQALELELDIDVRIGATVASNRVYCGLVGGKTRHEYGVLGPSVNLAARLMASPENQGILVNDAIRIQANKRFLFNTAMAPVRAKGYANLVPIFEPLSIIERKWKKPRLFIGRNFEIMQILSFARSSMSVRSRRRHSIEIGFTNKSKFFNENRSKIVTISGECGIGKSAMVYQALQKIQRLEVGRKKRKISVTKIVCEEGDQFVPFSTCRSIFEQISFGLEDDYNHVSSFGFDSSSSSVVDIKSMRRLSEIALTSEQMERITNTDYTQQNSDSRSELSEFSAFSGSTTNVTMEYVQAICERFNKSEDFAQFIGLNIFGIKSYVAKKDVTAPKENEIVDFFIDLFLKGSMRISLSALAIDDIQWMDMSSWHVLEGLFHRGQNLLIILIARNEYWHVRPNFLKNLEAELRSPLPRFKHIHLMGVSKDETTLLISRFLRKSKCDIDAEFCSNVYDHSGGMPFFAMEILTELKRKKVFEGEASPVQNKFKADLDHELNFGFNYHQLFDTSISSLSNLLLRRLDEFSSQGRLILQICAILDFNFQISEIFLVYNGKLAKVKRGESSVTEIVIETLQVAVTEGILVESFLGSQDVFEERKDINIEVDSTDDTSKQLQIRCYAFSHSMWRSALLNTMLKEKKQNLHKHIGDAMEANGLNQMDQSQMIRYFRHRRDSGDSMKTSEIVLLIASQFDKNGMFHHTLLLVRETLAMWSLNLLLRDSEVKGMRTDELEASGGIKQLCFETLHISSLLKILELLVVAGRCLGGVYQGVAKFAAFHNAYAIMLKVSMKTKNNSLGHNSFAVFSGLLLCLKTGTVPLTKEAAVIFEQKLVHDFVSLAERYGEAAHICRALAAQSQTEAKMGYLDRALSTQKKLASLYSPLDHSEDISKLYGSDRAVQNFGMAAIWFDLLDMEEELSQQIDFVLEELLPNMDLGNVHNTFMLIFPIMNTMKKRGRAREAGTLFKTFVVDKFHENYREGKSTFFLPLYKPILTLFQLSGSLDEKTKFPLSSDVHSDWIEWALREENGKFTRHMESGVVVLGRDGKTIVAEICLLLATKCRHIDSTQKDALIKKGIKLVHESLDFKYNSLDLCMYAKTESKKVLSSLLSL